MRPEDNDSAFEALLVDFGGVLTSSILEAFGDFCESAGIPRHAVATALRNDRGAARLLRDLETGHLSESGFELRFARMLCAGTGVRIDPTGLLDRLTETLRPDQAMLEALERVHDAGYKTAIVSNSLGNGLYDGYELERRADQVILSCDVHIRKPSRRIYLLAAEAVGVQPSRCIFVDDLEQNLVGAERVGMTGVHHTDASTTVPRLEQLLKLEVSGLRSLL